MKKISIVQFEPIIGGESTLCESLSTLLTTYYDVKIYHPCQLIDGGKLKISRLWQPVKNGKFVPYSHIKNVCETSDTVIFLNSVHMNTRTLYSDIRELLATFSAIRNANLVFYEHGLHTWHQCDYSVLFSILNTANNIKVLTNTNEAVKLYQKRGYEAFLCRQPFVPKNRKLQKNSSNVVNVCFNSRFSLNKGVDRVIDYFHEFLNDDEMNFSLNFRESGLESEKLDSLKNIVRNSRNGKLWKYTQDSYEIYNEQDFCLFFGYDDLLESGKLEYSLLEAIHFEIPVIVHPSWLRNFKYTEYGFDKEIIDKCFIKLDPYTFKDIVSNPKDYRYTIESAKVLLEDFSTSKILQRVKLCIDI